MLRPMLPHTARRHHCNQKRLARAPLGNGPHAGVLCSRCNFEQSVAGLSAGTRKLLVLGKDTKPQRATQHRTPSQLQRLYADEGGCRFANGKDDREKVAKLYADLYKRMKRYDKEQMPNMVRKAEDHYQRWCRGSVWLALLYHALGAVALLGGGAWFVLQETSLIGTILALSIVSILAIILLTHIIPSPRFQVDLAALRSRSTSPRVGPSEEDGSGDGSGAPQPVQA